jgi:hypothetical protein
MATDPVGDPIAEEVRDILAAHPELRERFRQLEEQIAAGIVHAHSHEDVARMLGFEDELEPGSS